MSTENLRQQLRAMCRGSYDLQKLRIQTGLRLVATLKVKMGQDPGVSEEEAQLDEMADAILKRVRADMDLISTWAAENAISLKPKNFKAQGIISNFTEYQLAQNYLVLVKQEETQFKNMEYVLREFPIYKEFLKKVRGCGPAMSAVIISEIDIHQAKYASSIWKYAGLDVVINQDGTGEGRSRKAHHLVEVEYKNKKGEMATRDSITFNPFLKTKLIGVLGGGFLKTGIRNEKQMVMKNGKPVIDTKTGKPKMEVVADADGKKKQEALSKYAQIYLDYKHRIENMPAHTSKTPAHRHKMAVRYAVKIFLIDLYAKWRELEGLEVHAPYHVVKLGLSAHAA